MNCVHTCINYDRTLGRLEKKGELIYLKLRCAWHSCTHPRVALGMILVFFYKEYIDNMLMKYLVASLVNFMYIMAY